jgi:S1-C subfamily serine protease
MGVVCIAAFAAYLVLPPRTTAPVLPTSTVKVQTGTGHGSGVHIGGGLVLSAAHVVKSADKVRIKTQDGKEVDALVLWTNPAYDTALLHAPALRAEKSQLACRTPIVGEAVHAFGNPMGVEFAQTWGRISGFVPDDIRDRGNVLVNIAFIPGMSGGPLFDRHGRVLGLIQATFGEFALGAAVPATAVCQLLGRV